MHPRVFFALLISCAVTATGCPTRVVTNTDGGRDTTPTAGSGGSGGRGAGGAAGGAGRGDLGGHAGAPTLGAGGALGGMAGGTAGSSTTGEAGHGGAAGANSPVGGSGGGTAGAGGRAGGTAGAGSPVGGAGGADDSSSTSVVCGQVANCPLENGGRCCYSAMDQSSACQASGATCDAVPSGPGTYFVKTTIACDSSADCASGEICCYTQIYISSSTTCMAAASCVDVTGPTGGYNTYRRQVCDPTKVAPTECLSGSCKTAPTYSQNLPPYLFLCL